MNWTSLLSPGGNIYNFVMSGNKEQKELAIESLKPMAEFTDRYNNLPDHHKETIQQILSGKNKPVVSAVKVTKKASPKFDMYKHIVSMANKSCSIVVLENVLIRKDGYIIGTNLETWLGYKLPNYSADTPILVPGNILKGLKAEDILGSSIDLTTFNGVLKTRNGDIKFASTNTEDFPKISNTVKSYGATFTQEMVDTIKSLEGYLAKDPLRPALESVYVTDKVIVATDAHRLKWVDTKTDVNEKGIMIHRNSVKYIIPGDAIISDEAQVLHITTDNMFMRTRLIDGNYPKWENVVPQENPIKITLDRQQMLTNLDMLSKVWNKATQQVKLALPVSKMHSEDIDYSKELTLDMPILSVDIKQPKPFEKDGKTVTPPAIELFDIGFNGNFLIQVLKESKQPTFTLEISRPNRAGIIDGNILVMPIMLS